MIPGPVPVVAEFMASRLQRQLTRSCAGLIQKARIPSRSLLTRDFSPDNMSSCDFNVVGMGSPERSLQTNSKGIKSPAQISVLECTQTE